MRKKMTWLWLAILLPFVLPAQTSGDGSYHILYGNHDSIASSRAEGVIRLFLDKDGFIYPARFISNDSLKKHRASLKETLMADRVLLNAIASGCGVPPNLAPGQTFAALQDSLLSVYTRSVNTCLDNGTIVNILIHGFRKPFEKTNRDYTSVEDYAAIRHQIISKATRPNLFVEIYWDSMYDCCITWNGWRHNKQIFTLFESESTRNALIAGLSLRPFVSAIRSAHLNIITHSLGAAVASELLFNNAADTQLRAREARLPTPVQQLFICMLGPAISSDVFKNYYRRTTAETFSLADNYTLSVGYNNRDFALLKKDPLWLRFGPGPYRYGVTTLGCNKDHDIKKLERLFKDNYPNSRLSTADLTGSVCHYFRCYHNKPGFEPLLIKMQE